MSNRLLALVAILCVAGLVFSTSMVMAEDDVTVSGTVTACAKDCKAGCPGTLKAEAGTYKITNDENGKKLVKDNDGKKVEVKGTVAKKDDGNWLTVKSSK